VPRRDGAKNRRSRDGEWTKQCKKSHFRYKLHSKDELAYGLIRELETTPANCHDSQVNLSVPGEIVLRDREYLSLRLRELISLWNAGRRRDH
jgi:transposase, IS5 family